MATNDFARATDAIARLGTGAELTQSICGIEASLAGEQQPAAERTIASHGIDEAVLHRALTIKDLAGQIHVVIHTVGMLVALPHILERAERIESVSLGAGNTGREYDLVTDRRIAEFKFIQWRGADSIRQNNLFIDLFNLASAETDRRRYMYVVDREHPDRFLASRRALSSVLSGNAAAAARFRALHGERFKTVADYYAAYVKDRVEIVDLRAIVPAFGA